MNLSVFHLILGVIVLMVIIAWPAALLLRKMAGLSKAVLKDTGKCLAESSWGSARLNGVGANNVVKIRRFEKGVQLQLIPLFGGGHLWLPNDELQIEKAEGKRFFEKTHVVLKTSKDHVKVYGNLAESVGLTPKVI